MGARAQGLEETGGNILREGILCGEVRDKKGGSAGSQSRPPTGKSSVNWDA